MELYAKLAVIRVRLSKAHQDLDAIRDLLKVSRWRGAVIFAYYAMFDAASAALLWLNIERTKHSAVQASFNEFFVKPGLIEVEYGQLYRTAREWRKDQDYSDVAAQPDESTATHIVNDAERFVARLERYLREAGAIE